MKVSKRLTQKRVHELFNYDPESGLLIRKVQISNKASVGDVVGYKEKRGYLKVGIDRGRYRVHRVVWLWWYGYFPENEIDHINRDKSDNSILNLRELSHQCNVRNKGNSRNNTSGVKGVVWDKRAKSWSSRIDINGKRFSLGHYKGFNNAVCARLAAEQCLGWEGCDSNSPALQYVQKNIIKK